MTATTIHCPLCGITVIGQGPDPAAAVTAAGAALAQHLDDHHKGEES